jgi:diguanylate cyclase (GGDEF)-like protein
MGIRLGLSGATYVLRPRPIVLVVDDHSGNRTLIARMLDSDYEVIAASNGEEALALAPERLPDLVLLDVAMPEMDGYRVCAALRGDVRTKDIPIIFITAMAGDADHNRGLDAGGIDYITKPFNASIVKARVRNHLELKQRRDELAHMTFVDELTGIANRRQGYAALEREWRRTRRIGAPLSLLMLDIDQFKLLNDAQGHPAGDECLRQVAQTLAANIHRPADMLARCGGEEFICILPETDAKGAELVAEKLRQAVARLDIPHPTSPVAPYVTLSVGAVTMAPDAELSADELVQIADDMLYAAKHGGRNRVVAATDLEICLAKSRT